MKNIDISYCEDLVRKHDYYRYLITLFFSKEQRDHLIVLYAFHYEIAKIQEITSEPMTGLIRLQWWRDALDEIYDGKNIRNHQVVKPLNNTIRECNLKQSDFLSLIDARDLDVEFKQPSSIDELEEYCQNTASNLLLLSSKALGGESDLINQVAKHIGIAWGLVGVVRNLRFNALKQRIQLPTDLLSKYNISNEEIIQGENIDKTNKVVEELINCVISHINLTKKLKSEIPKNIRPLFLLDSITESFSKRIRKNDYNVFTNSIEEPVFPILAKLYWCGLLGR